MIAGFVLQEGYLGKKFFIRSLDPNVRYHLHMTSQRFDICGTLVWQVVHSDMLGPRAELSHANPEQNKLFS